MKAEVERRWGVLDRLEILKEADTRTRHGGLREDAGILCMVKALLVVVAGVIGLLAASRSSSTSDTANSIAVGLALPT